MKKSKGVFIAIEGPIGVGKTTLANILNNHFKGYLLREIVEENPFLSKFYENKEDYALQTEAFFLFNRVKQLEDVEKNNISNSEMVISDYHIIKNLIFAGITLNTMQFHKYRQMYNIFINDLPQPDIIIYLNSDTTTLMNRIATRDRSFERQMDVNYINRLNEEYKYYFKPLSIKYNFLGKEPVVLNIDNSNLDVINDAKAREFIISEVEKAIKTIASK